MTLGVRRERAVIAVVVKFAATALQGPAPKLATVMRRGERTKSVKVVPARASNPATQNALVRELNEGNAARVLRAALKQLAHTVESAWASTRQPIGPRRYVS